MATQKPISTVSYNTEPFLKEQLEKWVKAHIIQSFQYICHKGEDGDKDHIHLRLEPNKKLDPMDLTEQLREFEKGKDKPLGVRPWRPSKEEDWYLYVVHDPIYLKLKYGGGEKGEKIPYKWQDIKASEFYDVEVAFIRAKAYLEHTSVNMASKLKKGEEPIDLIMQGENPYMVGAITRLLASNDYTRVCDELQRTLSRLDDLVKAIHDHGLEIEIDQDGNTILTNAGTEQTP